MRWVWETEGYTTQVTHDHADGYLREIAVADHTQEHKLNVVKSLEMLFAWLEHERGYDEYEPAMEFSQPQRRDTTGDAFDRRERRQIREAALSYGSIPHYSAVTPAERDTWKAYLARRFEKPKSDVGLDDWERANGWKYPSLVWCSLDAALRPIEVERAKLSWLDLDRQRLVIPKEDDVKTKRADRAREWTVALTERTTESLRRWVRQRACYEKYDDTEALWLTRYGNPYGSSSLKRLVTTLCDIAGIETANRKVSWYSIRRGTVTEIVEESDLSTAAEQVRHVDIRSTARYDQVSDRRRREVLERLG
jgi:integrase